MRKKIEHATPPSIGSAQERMCRWLDACLAHRHDGLDTPTLRDASVRCHAARCRAASRTSSAFGCLAGHWIDETRSASARSGLIG